ncbi:MAG: hypothetical protein COA70_12515 [Planctomycetota bacterium]|nr:MAG: hypothetical protein COA70_12515 [Planctomycetota bacterium]
MKITVNRFVSDDESTISNIAIDGQDECFGLEDEYREVKVSAETRIPAGNYKVALRKEGRLHNSYSLRFPKIHRGMLHVLDVPGFQWILIHCGNTEVDTAGCLLVGSSAVTEKGKMSIASSGSAYENFYPQVVDESEAGNLEIEFLDND